MKQLTVDYIKAAYEETGLRPVRDEFGHVKQDGKICGCVLTVLACKNHKASTEYEFADLISELEDDNFKLAGVSEEFGRGIIYGFDESASTIRVETYRHKSEEWLEGYRLGFAVRNELFEYNQINGEWVLKEG